MRCGFSLWIQKIPWWRVWQSTPVSWPGESHGLRSLAACNPWGVTKSLIWLKWLSMRVVGLILAGLVTFISWMEILSATDSLYRNLVNLVGSWRYQTCFEAPLLRSQWLNKSVIHTSRWISTVRLLSSKITVLEDMLTSIRTKKNRGPQPLGHGLVPPIRSSAALD